MQEVLTNELSTLIVGTILFSLLSVFMVLFVLLYNKAQLKFKLERQEFQQAILQAEIEIREQTLSNVSKELHDNIGQIASLLKINLNQLEGRNGTLVVLDDSKELLQKLINDVKGISASLEGNKLLESGLSQSIEKDCSRMQKLGQLAVDFRSNTEKLSLENSSTIFLYRMYQEAINNILTHSQATQVLIDLDTSPTAFQMSIKDNGVGFKVERLASGGNGLKNLKERSKAIGAEIPFTALKKGTEIMITLPLNDVEQ